MLQGFFQYFVLGAAVLLSLYVALGYYQILKKLSRTDAKLDLLIKHAGLEFEPFKGLPTQVIDAIKRGEKVKAVKLYREACGVSLKQAKAVIDELERLA